MDMGSNYTPEEWQAWKDKQRAAHNNGNGHGASLTQEALTFGASTPPQLLPGN
jgi:DNA (cytosine-5)-methyltransferase 1